MQPTLAQPGGTCDHCEMPARQRYPLRYTRPNPTEVLVCRLCFVRLTGIEPSRSRTAVRLAR